MKNDKQFDSYKKFALKTCSNYAEILNLREWDIHISFINGDGGVSGMWVGDDGRTIHVNYV